MALRRSAGARLDASLDAPFEERVARVLCDLRSGEVVSYGEVAAEAGSPGAARAVGNLLRRGLSDVPWWRVVRADGAIACRTGSDQANRLIGEGVVVCDGRVRPWPRGGGPGPGEGAPMKPHVTRATRASMAPRAPARGRER